MEMREVELENLSELLKICRANLSARLPKGWTLKEGAKADTGYDAAFVLKAPGGIATKLIVEMKMSLERRNVASVLDQLDVYTRGTGATALVISRYLSPSVREALAERSASYIDATGNIRIQIETPLVYISDRGQDSDPWRNRLGRPRGTLKGVPASRVIRSLVDINRDWSVRELVEESGVSTGATYRVLQYLEGEDLVRKNSSGRYEVEAWRPIVEAWSKDYGFQKANRTVSFLDPRGISNLSDIARSTTSFKWAFTGSVAASEWAPYAPARAGFVYVEDISMAVAAWGLRATKTGANVILAEPESDVVFNGTTYSRTGLRIAAPAQVAVDLLTSPGRNPSEGVELLNWMEQNERLWRR